MNGKSNLVLATGLIVLVAAFAPACDKGEVLAPKDATITLTAIPTQVVFEAVNPKEKHVSLTAQVLASGGYPQPGVAVRFAAAVGDLASNGLPVTTNVNSVALDVLTLQPGAPASVDVTAASGSLSQKVTISTSSAACTNLAPTANAGADQTLLTHPLGTFTVNLDGSGSTGGSSTYDDQHYIWDCGPGGVLGSDPNHLNDSRYATCTYTATVTVTPQSWTVTLTVKTDPICDNSTPPVCGCQKSATDTMKVTNTAPAVTP
jgi:hypothetical protein